MSRQKRGENQIHSPLRGLARLRRFAWS
jgi:hypothetical protein